MEDKKGTKNKMLKEKIKKIQEKQQVAKQQMREKTKQGQKKNDQNQELLHHLVATLIPNNEQQLANIINFEALSDLEIVYPESEKVTTKEFQNALRLFATVEKTFDHPSKMEDVVMQCLHERILRKYKRRQISIGEFYRTIKEYVINWLNKYELVKFKMIPHGDHAILIKPDGGKFEENIIGEDEKKVAPAKKNTKKASTGTKRSAQSVSDETVTKKKK